MPEPKTKGGALVSAGRIYVREVPGCRGHVVVGISTARLHKIEEAEVHAFAHMLKPVATPVFKHRVARWRRLRNAVLSARKSWAKLWGIA